MSSSSWTTAHARAPARRRPRAGAGRRRAARPRARRRRARGRTCPTGRAVERHLPGGGEVGGLGAGQPEQPGQRGVDPLALEAVGDGQRAARSAIASAPAVGVPAARARPPRPVDADAAQGEQRDEHARRSTIAESARLKTGQCGSCEEVDDVAADRRPGARNIRSVRLPSAPPSSSPSATAQPAAAEPAGRSRTMTTTTLPATSGEDPGRAGADARTPRRGCG